MNPKRWGVSSLAGSVSKRQTRGPLVDVSFFQTPSSVSKTRPRPSANVDVVVSLVLVHNFANLVESVGDSIAFIGRQTECEVVHSPANDVGVGLCVAKAPVGSHHLASYGLGRLEGDDLEQLGGAPGEHTATIADVHCCTTCRVTAEQLLLALGIEEDGVVSHGHYSVECACV